MIADCSVNMYVDRVVFVYVSLLLFAYACTTSAIIHVCRQ